MLLNKRKTFGEYLEQGIGNSFKTALKNLQILRESNFVFDDYVLNQPIFNASFREQLPTSINNNTILEWIDNANEKVRKCNSRGKQNYRLKNKIKSVTGGDEILNNLIQELSDINRKINNIKASVMMESPKSYNNIRESYRTVQKAISYLVTANKEFIPKESE